MSSAYYIWQDGATFFNPVINASSGIYSFDPVPLMTWNKTYERRGDEERLYATTTIDLSGTIFDNIGINAPTGGTRLQRIAKQQDLLENAFGEDHHNFIIFDDEGYVVMSIYPRVNSLTFEEGVWAQTCSYSLSLVDTEEDDLEGTKEDIEVQVRVAKNKFSAFKGRINMTFYRSLSKFEDIGNYNTSAKKQTDENNLFT